jgi:hypothetical protein
LYLPAVVGIGELPGLICVKGLAPRFLSFAGSLESFSQQAFPWERSKKMLKRFLIPLILLACPPTFYSQAVAEDVAASPKIQEEIWALPFPLPVLAFVVRPVGDGPFPLVIMNHGIALGVQERTMFPTVEYRAAAEWFAKRGYFVISPVRYGASSLDIKDRGIFGAVFAHVGSCDKPNFRGPGLAVATLNEWVIDCSRKPQPIISSGHHHLRGGTGRQSRRQAQQQLCSR